MIPPKIKRGDEIRVICPSRSAAIISKDSQDIASKRLEGFGFKVSYARHCNEKDEFNSSSIKSRVEDVHEAFKDKNVKGILTMIGGFNSNQILRYLDYNIIKSNPKILCGYSDITTLQNTIYRKTGLVTYSGPHFSTFGMVKGIDYTVEYFKKCLMDKMPFDIVASKEWSDDEWYKNQEKREFIKNDGYLIINQGEAEGTLIGGNLCTFNLLQGTEFMPRLKDTILFLEDDDESKPHHFDRDLQSLIHQPGFEKVRGIVLGRFQKKSEMTLQKIIKIITSKKELDNIPVVANVDFGHTTPQITYPVGGNVSLAVSKNKTSIRILKH